MTQMAMEGIFSRTEMLLGAEGMSRLSASTVAVFGIGGVGSFAAEALARAGIGRLVLVDHDVVSLSNINRQLHATAINVGRLKTEAMTERLKQIRPDLAVDRIDGFYTPQDSERFFPCHYDYVVDAVDTLTGKIPLVIRCKELGIPIVSSMGAGNKMDPTKFRVADIYGTCMDPLARIMRKKLRERGVSDLKVVYSEEPPMKPFLPVKGKDALLEDLDSDGDKRPGRKLPPGSVSFVPSVAGLILAGEVIKDLAGSKRYTR